MMGRPDGIDALEAEVERWRVRYRQDTAALHAKLEKAEAEVQRLLKWIDGYPCACPRPTSVPIPDDDIDEPGVNGP